MPSIFTGQEESLAGEDAGWHFLECMGILGSSLI